MKHQVASILEKMSQYVDAQGITYTVAADAPDTYERLQEECTPTSLAVWSGASKYSIWGKTGNYLFRAVHDHIHLKYGQDFSPVGETMTCLFTCKLLGLDEAESKVMYAEIVGQLEYKNRTGMFPENQRAFVNYYLKGA